MGKYSHILRSKITLDVFVSILQFATFLCLRSHEQVMWQYILALFNSMHIIFFNQLLKWIKYSFPWWLMMFSAKLIYILGYIMIIWPFLEIHVYPHLLGCVSVITRMYCWYLISQLWHYQIAKNVEIKISKRISAFEPMRLLQGFLYRILVSCWTMRKWYIGDMQEISGLFS